MHFFLIAYFLLRKSAEFASLVILSRISKGENTEIDLEKRTEYIFENISLKRVFRKVSLLFQLQNDIT